MTDFIPCQAVPPLPAGLGDREAGGERSDEPLPTGTQGKAAGGQAEAAGGGRLSGFSEGQRKDVARWCCIREGMYVCMYVDWCVCVCVSI